MGNVVGETVQLYRRKRVLQMHFVCRRLHQPLSMVFLVVLDWGDGERLISTGEVVICFDGETKEEHCEGVGIFSRWIGGCLDVIRDFEHGHDSTDVAMGSGKVAAREGEPGEERDRDHVRIIDFDLSDGRLDLRDDLLDVATYMEICAVALVLLDDGGKGEDAVSDNRLVDTLHENIDHLRETGDTPHELWDAAKEEGKLIRVGGLDIQIVRG
jgi:hypothetical protein